MGDAWRRAPWADLLYHADGPWWWAHDGVPAFSGEKWTQHEGRNKPSHPHGKGDAVAAFGLRMVHGEKGSPMSFDPSRIRWGGHSGFQAVNLAVLFGAARIVLLGFDCQATGGRKHFFGDHPAPLSREHAYNKWLTAWETAAPQLASAGVEVINATRETALRCFPRVSIEELTACTSSAA